VGQRRNRINGTDMNLKGVLSLLCYIGLHERYTALNTDFPFGIVKCNRCSKQWRRG